MSQPPYFPPPPNRASQKLNKARHYTFSLILLFSLTTVVLGVIYTSCVLGGGHSTALSPSSSDPGSTTSAPFNADVPTASQHATYLPRRDPETPGVADGYGAMYTPNNPNQSAETNSTPGGSTDTSHSASGKADSSDSDYLDVETLFYTLTVPFLTFAHAATELTYLFASPSSLLSLFSNVFSLAISVLLAAGWVVSASLWTHCELAPASATATYQVCPAHVRGHFMYGVHELSVAKTAVGWVILAVYMVQLGLAGSTVRTLWKLRRNSANVTRQQQQHNRPRRLASRRARRDRDLEPEDKDLEGGSRNGSFKMVRFSPGTAGSEGVMT